MNKLSKREQKTVLLVGMLGIFILYVYVQYVLFPLSRQAKAVGSQVRQVREQLRMIEMVLTNEEQVRHQHDELERTVTSLRSLLPPEERLSAVIERLSDIASQTQVKIQTIFPQREAAEDELAAALKPANSKPPVYKMTPIQIDALAGFHELGAFLSLVETGTSPMEISSLRISSNANQIRRHQVKLVLNVFFATADPSTARSAAAGGSAGSAGGL